MSFQEAVVSCFRQYAGFSGRARRSEFWWFWVFAILVSAVLGIIDQALGSKTGVLTAIFPIVILLPSLAVAVRRLHDGGHSGWLLLIGLIPILGWVLILYWYIQPTQPMANRHGPVPGQESAPPSAPPPAPAASAPPAASPPAASPPADTDSGTTV
jgi:uncharacterized membrane protein YhaH (DUF805 family)